MKKQTLSLPLTLQSDIFIVFFIFGLNELEDAANLLQYFRSTAKRVHIFCPLCHFFPFAHVSRLNPVAVSHLDILFEAGGIRQEKNDDTDVHEMHPREKGEHKVYMIQNNTTLNIVFSDAKENTLHAACFTVSFSCLMRRQRHINFQRC